MVDAVMFVIGYTDVESGSVLLVPTPPALHFCDARAAKSLYLLFVGVNFSILLRVPGREINR